MHFKLRLNAFSVLIVAICFCWFFEISKHDPLLSRVNAFAEDPFDAVGSFGVQAAAILSALSLLRALWRYPTGHASDAQQAVLTRTQMLSILAVGITLAGDIVAMVRYPSLWIGSPTGRLLALLLGCITLLTVLAGSFIYRSAAKFALPRNASSRKSAVIVSVVFVLSLALYPGNWRHGMAGALLTVLAGDILLVVPMRVLGTSLVPYRIETDPNDPAALAWNYLRRYQWTFIVLLGILAGLALAWGELREPKGSSYLTGRIVLVGFVYLGLETAALLLAYALLRNSLGILDKKVPT